MHFNWTKNKKLLKSLCRVTPTPRFVISVNYLFPIHMTGITLIASFVKETRIIHTYAILEGENKRSSSWPHKANNLQTRKGLRPIQLRMSQPTHPNEYILLPVLVLQLACFVLFRSFCVFLRVLYAITEIKISKYYLISKDLRSSRVWWRIRQTINRFHSLLIWRPSRQHGALQFYQRCWCNFTSFIWR